MNTDEESFEQKILDSWKSLGVTVDYLEKNKDSASKFSFLDGPITANNPMGVHHGWGRTYKDIWQRYHNMKGDAQRFQNGFDCQGLWVEVEVEKELKLKSKKDIENLVPGDKNASIDRFIKMCKDRVNKYANIQTEQSKRLGYFMDWDRSYFTMDSANNYAIWLFLKVCFDNDWIYKGNDAVAWCPRCGTAISQHEILTEDYKEMTHSSIIVSFALQDDPSESLLVWTTTPWTIPGNVAVAVSSKEEYSCVMDLDKKAKYWMASAVVPTIMKDKKYEIIKTLLGEKLVGFKYRSPFDEFEIVEKAREANIELFQSVVATNEQILPISTTEGTGLVHLAPGAGTQDYALCKKLNLPVIELIDEEGVYLNNLGEFRGKNATTQPEIIFDFLKEGSDSNTWVFEILPFTHRYPACWRCKTSLVWRVVDEWYIAMDRPTKVDVLLDFDDTRNSPIGLTLRERMKRVARSINWIPSFGLERELDWLDNMHDWLISKKRYWGLALPIWVCDACNDFVVIGSKDELKNRATKGVEILDQETPHRPHVDKITLKCEKCDGQMHRILDVGNPWLDAGIVPFSTMNTNNFPNEDILKSQDEIKKWFPADFITESFPGQFKNWFYALIAMSTVLTDSAPFKNVLGFATVLAEDGRPMHKSWGNSIEFNEGASEIGVDVMRWIYASAAPQNSLLFGKKRGDEVRRNVYLLLKNCSKYVLDYCNMIKAPPNSQKDFITIDDWMLSLTNSMIERCDFHMKNYQLFEVTKILEDTLLDFSTWYIRRNRDRLSNPTLDNMNSVGACLFVMKNFIDKYLIINSMIMPFLSHELYSQMNPQIKSVCLEKFPISDSVLINEKLSADMELVREICNIGNRVRKEKSLKLRQPLASGTINLSKGKKFILQDGISNYAQIISQELNIKECIFVFDGRQGEEIEFVYDEVLTPKLALEGKARDIIRQIQTKRKEMGLNAYDKITLVLPMDFGEFTQMILTKSNAISSSLGEEILIIKI